MAVGGVEEASCQVVLVPAGEDQDDWCAGGEAGGCDVGPPVPDAVAVDGGVCLFAVFDGVVDNEEVDGSACEAAADACGVDAALCLGELPFVLG